jgi:hypothetical protein
VTALVWDKSGERTYQNGVDRGVLYLQDGTAVVWNGLTGVQEGSDKDLQEFYLDGVKYLETLTPSDFKGKLKAYTYPDEFEKVNGIALIAEGLAFHDQPASSFSLSYRTGIGSDLNLDLGYKIHILYNVLAKQDDAPFETIKDSGATPVEFSWDLSGTPPRLTKFRPTVHISIDSRTTDPDVLAELEETLYGSDRIEPSLPAIEEIAGIFGVLGPFIITDHRNGTWTASDPGGAYITMVSPTQFRFDDVDAAYLDATTYEVSSTNAV